MASWSGDRPGEVTFVAESMALETMLAPLLDPVGKCRTVESLAAPWPSIAVWDGAWRPHDAEPMVVAAERGETRLVVAVPEAALDDWGFAIGRRNVEIVMRDDVTAIGLAIMRRSRPTATVGEGPEDEAVNRLRELGAEVAEIARVLERLRQPGRRGRRDYAPPPPTAAPTVDAPAIRRMIRARRQRDRFFPDGLFADPGWDILLDLMAARLEGKAVAVSSLCIAAAVPNSTALRWIALMTEQGLLVRVADPTDRRRVFIALAEDTAERMAGCLAAMTDAAAVA